MSLYPIETSKASLPSTQFTSEVSREHGMTYRDTISSEIREGDKQTFLKKTFTFVLGLFIFVLTLPFVLVKKFIYLISCCKLCKDQIDPKEIKNSLNPVIEAWRNHGSNVEEVWVEFCHKFPGIKDQMIETIIGVERQEKLGQSTSPERQEKWREREAKLRKEADEDIRQHRVGFLESYVIELQKEIDRRA